MTPMAAIAAAPARTPNLPGEATASDGDGERGFAAALDLAREPAKSTAQGAARDQGKPAANSAARPAEKSAAPAQAKTQEKTAPAADTGVADAAADDPPTANVDAVVIESALLLPGWPVAVTITPLAGAVATTGAAATTSAVAAAGAAAPTDPVAAAGAAATPAAAATADGNPLLDGIAPGLLGKRAVAPKVDAPRPERSLPAAALPAPAAAPTGTAPGDRAQPAPLAGAPTTAIDAALAAGVKPRADSLPTVASTSTASPAFTLSNVQMTASASLAATVLAQPVFAAHLAAALDSPAFAPALATQVAWLVQEGQQLARLTLNPADMGPVTVRIVVDGTQARVDFHAAMAGTRAAIEASLPALAAALHDSGLTLAGGGVSDGQARQGAAGERGAQAPGPGYAATATTGQIEINPALPLRAARGLVDLIA